MQAENQVLYNLVNAYLIISIYFWNNYIQVVWIIFHVTGLIFWWSEIKCVYVAWVSPNSVISIVFYSEYNSKFMWICDYIELGHQDMELRLSADWIWAAGKENQSLVDSGYYLVTKSRTCEASFCSSIFTLKQLPPFSVERYKLCALLKWYKELLLRIAMKS